MSKKRNAPQKPATPEVAPSVQNAGTAPMSETPIDETTNPTADSGVDTAAAVDTATQADTPVVLNGSSTHESSYVIGENTVALGELVQAAFERSGLDASTWNNLADADRDERIDFELKKLQGEAVKEPEAEVAAPAAETDAIVAAAPQGDEPKVSDAEQVKTPVTETPEAATEEAEQGSTKEEKLLAHLQTLFPNLKELSTSDKNLIDSLDQYIDTMGHNHIITPPAGGVQQRRMYQNILGAFKSENWAVQIEIILYYFATYRATHFQDRLLHRFMDAVSLQTPDRLRFEGLMRLFRVGADVKSRSIIANEIDFTQLLGRFKDNDIKERIMAVFKIS